MIKELNGNEIKIVEDYIQLVFKNNPDYKYYFLGEPKRNYAKRGFLIGNNSFYVDVELISSVNFVGICKLQTVKNNFLTDIITLFERLYEEYGRIGIIRGIEDKKTKKLHEHIRKRFEKRGDIVKSADNGIISVTIITKKGGVYDDLKKYNPL